MPGGARGGGLGIGGLIIVGLIAWALGVDPRLIIGGLEMVQGPGRKRSSKYPAGQRKTGAPGDELGQFVSAVLGSTEDRWNEIFAQAGQRYRAPRLVIFSGATRNRPAASRSRPWGHFIAHRNRPSISTPRSFSNCSGASVPARPAARAASSRRPM
jgi:uncharacterized protein